MTSLRQHGRDSDSGARSGHIEKALSCILPKRCRNHAHETPEVRPGSNRDIEPWKDAAMSGGRRIATNLSRSDPSLLASSGSTPVVRFSYAEPSDPALKRFAVRGIELATGQPKLRRLYRKYDGREDFFDAAVRLFTPRFALRSGTTGEDTEDRSTGRCRQSSVRRGRRDCDQSI